MVFEKECVRCSSLTFKQVVTHNILSMKDTVISMRYLEFEKDLLSLERTFCV